MLRKKTNYRSQAAGIIILVVPMTARRAARQRAGRPLPNGGIVPHFQGDLDE
jgi:hypothetical protein